MSRGPRVNRRHVDVDLGPLHRRRRLLNRASLGVAALFALAVLGTMLLRGQAAPDGPDADAGGYDRVEVAVADAVPVQVVRIVDGDTLHVRSAETEITVRLYGVDTPEVGEACYDEATDRLVALAGDVVQLLPDERLTDQYGRELRYVYASDGTLIDEALVAEGYGRAWTDDGSLREEIMAAESDARAEARGCLWGG